MSRQLHRRSSSSLVSLGVRPVGVLAVCQDHAVPPSSGCDPSVILQVLPKGPKPSGLRAMSAYAMVEA